MRMIYVYLTFAVLFATNALPSAVLCADLQVNPNKNNPVAVQPQGAGTPADPYRIATLSHLYWLAAPDEVVPEPNREYRWQANYIQLNNINAAATETWFDGQGWIPIGTFGMGEIPFSGVYHGMSHVIENLHINRPHANNLGLFGYTEGAEIKHLGLTDVFIEGSFFIGGLVGVFNEDSEVRHCFVTGELIAIQYAGGLIGQVYGSFVRYSYSDISVTAGSILGGLAGEVIYSEISQSFSLGSVISDYEDSPWKKSDFEQSLPIRDRPESSHTAGGLAGSGYFAVITNCYSRATVEAQMDAGGLMGNMNESHIINSFSSGPVSGEWSVGGLVGSRWTSEALNCFWDTETSGQTTSAGGVGKTTEEMQDIQTYLAAGWDFYGESVNGEEDIWGINEAENDGYPFLMWQHDEEIPDIDLEDALAALEAAADAMEDHLAATGQETDAAYVAVEDAVEALNQAIDADPPSQEDIDDATGALLDAVAVLEDATQALITGILAAADTALDEAEAAQTAYTEYGGDTSHGLYTTVSHRKQVLENLLTDGPLDYQTIINATITLNDATQALNDALENGQFAVAPAAGDGTPFYPYEIETLQNLYWIALNADEWSSFFLQIAHIDASPTQNWHDGQGWEPIGLGWVPKDSDDQKTKGTEFNGWYIGDGHEISGLYLNRPLYHHAGLFGAIGPNGVIIDLALKDADITAFASLGALAGENQGMIFRCFSTGSIDGQDIVGGLVGINLNGHITDSYSMAAVSGLEAVGGLAGSNIGEGYIAFSYAAGPVSSPDDNGGLIGEGDGTTHSSFWDTEASGQEASAGGVGKTTVEMMDIATYAEWEIAAVAALWYPDLNFTWNIVDNESYPFFSGQAIPYPGQYIYTWEDLHEIRNNLDGIYTLMNDLGPTDEGYDEFASAAANDANGWLPIGSQEEAFTGSFYGQQHTIEGLFIDRNLGDEKLGQGIGLFGYLNDAYIRDVMIVDANIEATRYIGALAGHIYETTIINSHVSGNISGYDYTGGLIGFMENSMLTGSGADIIVIGEDAFIGGLVGNGIRSEIRSSHAIGQVTGGNQTGGLAGAISASSKIVDCYTYSMVTAHANSFRIGGLAGNNHQSEIKNSLNLGSVAAPNGSYIGGIAGINSSSVIKNCISANIIDGGTAVGGIAGYSINHSSLIKNSFSRSDIYGQNSVGGLVGLNSSGQVKNAYIIGKVTAAGTNIGGLIGSNEDHTLVISSYWNTETSGQEESAGGEGRSTAEMTSPHDADTYLGWDFEDVWSEDLAYDQNAGYPFLTELFPIYFSPENLEARARYGRVELWWNSLSGALGVNIYRNGVMINEGLIEDNEFADFNVINDISYEYYITAVYADGESLPSNTVEAKPGKAVEPITTSGLGYIFEIATIENLHWIAVNPEYYNWQDGYSFIQVADIDASIVQEWFDGRGWKPIGSLDNSFSTTYDGQGYVINGLYINRCEEDYVGLFGIADDAFLDNITLTDVEICANNYVGAIAGRCLNTWTYSSSASGLVEGEMRVGGLIGSADESRIFDSYNECTVSGDFSVGGLAGATYHSLIRRSYNLGNITSFNSHTGGLSGNSLACVFSHCYNKGTIEGNQIVGGLVGQIGEFMSSMPHINYSYSNALVSGKKRVGGLAGYADGAVFFASYSISSLEGYEDVGGIAGSAAGNTQGQTTFWDIETSGVIMSPIGTGLLSKDMKKMATFTDMSWNFNDNWLIDGDNNQGYPYLQVEYRDISKQTPTNLEAETLDQDVLLNWNKPAIFDNDDKTSHGDEKDIVFLGYNVYRNMEVINQGLLQATSFIDEAADPLVFYEYFVEAVYGDDETFVSNTLTVFICEGAPVAVEPVGAGTENNPYEIASLENLYWIAANISKWDMHYYQTANIQAIETKCWNDGEGFIPIGFSEDYPFSGMYDGGNKTIERLHISRPADDYTGLFGYISEAHVTNLVIKDAAIRGRSYTGVLLGHADASTVENIQISGSVQGNEYIGGLAGFNNASAIDNGHFHGNVSGSNQVGGISGRNDNHSTIENSSSEGNALQNGNSVGGITGHNNRSTINGCHSNMTISGDWYVGGITGNNSISEISNCYFGGFLAGRANVGGIAGSNSNGEIQNCYNNGQVYGAQDVGGITGRSGLSSSLSNSYNTGSVSGSYNVGGITGYSNNGVMHADCYNTGNITAMRTVGGLVGRNSNNVLMTNSRNYGDVTALENGAGGLVAVNTSEAVINNSYNHGAVLSHGDYAGGLAAINISEAVIKKSFNIGTVISYGDYAGGLAAQNSSEAIIEQSFNTGVVQANADYAGGVAGHNDEATLQDVYNMGSVSGNNFVGGLVGYHDSFSHVYDSYSAGSVTGAGNDTGGLTGGAHLWGQTHNSYWDTETSGQTQSAGGEPRNTAEMTYPYADNTFVDWDFEESWQADPNHAVNQGYPFMKWYEPDDDEEVPEHRHLTNEVITPDDAELCYDALISITVSNFVVEAGAQVTFIAGESIAFHEGTHIEAGAYMHAYISDVFCLPDPLPKAVEAETAMPLQHQTFDDTRQGDFFKVYPNPTEAWFTIEMDIPYEPRELVHIEIFSIHGTRIQSKTMPAQSHINLDLGDQQPGMYIIRVAKGELNGVKRLIRR